VKEAFCDFPLSLKFNAREDWKSGSFLLFYSKIPVPGTNLASYAYGPSKFLATALSSTLK